jgi:Putative Actinobacterial Holin-X, holin superfamily III
MIDDFVQSLVVLQKAETLIGRMWLHVMARRLGLFAFAGLIAAFGLAMANVAGFYALQASHGPIWAAAIVAAADFVLAAIVALISRNLKPGPEIDRALEARKAAIESIQASAADVKAGIDGIGDDIRGVKDTISGFVHDPLDAALQGILIPAAQSLIGGLRGKKDRANAP